MKTNKVYDALLGVAIGDALGVPVEFKSRDYLRENPVSTMLGYGTYNQPTGTWSDDSSLTFCLAECLIEGYDLQRIAQSFIDWKYKAKWTAHGDVFDIGVTTSSSIALLGEYIRSGRADKLSGLCKLGNERTNGNGSLMRIMPLLFYIKGKDVKEQFDFIWEISALTHYHIRAAIACFIYLKVAEEILLGSDKHAAYLKSCKLVKQLFETSFLPQNERTHFERVLSGKIHQYPEESIESGGYVMHSLEASLWCFLSEDDYESAVLKAVNLGEDTDTTAAITGGLAGLYYGVKSIPTAWISQLAKLSHIKKLCGQLNDLYN